MIIDSLVFIVRWLITTIIWLICWVPFYLLGFFVTWIGLLFCNRNAEHMPFLWWFWDNSHGINGTINENNLNWVVICNPEIYNYRFEDRMSHLQYIINSKTGKERTFKNRWIWITWRNPVSNLSLYLMGIKIKKPIIKQEYTLGRVILQTVKCGMFWCYAITVKYNDNVGFYHSFGWKFLDPAENTARFIYRISPFKRLS